MEKIMSMDRLANVSWQRKCEEGILSLIRQRGTAFADITAFSHWERGQWKTWTYQQVTAAVKQLSDYLIEAGVKENDRVAILSESRPEWIVAFLAAIRCAAIVVPLDAKLTNVELAAILADAEPSVIFASAALYEAAESAGRELRTAPHVLLLNRHESDPESGAAHAVPAIAELRSSASYEVRERRADELALIVYTSGTTGAPKGVMVTLGNLLYQVHCFEQIANVNADDLLLSILPLNHLFELSVGLLAAMYLGARICYANTLYPKELLDIMRTKRVTRMIAVPLFLKMLKAGIEKQIQNAGRARWWIFQTALCIAAHLPRTVRRLMFQPVHKQFGGYLRQFVCGGAPLDVDVEQFFDCLGITVLQGYGLTETSPVITVNTSEHQRLGSVGRALPGTELKISASREIVVRGPSLMRGYYKRDDLTREAIDPDGWFHTGDLGEIDRDGFLYLTGRLKNLIVLGSGKKVCPEEVEAVLAQSPLFKEVCVLGTVSGEHVAAGTESVCAVVVPSDSLVERCGSDIPLVEEQVYCEVVRLCESLAPYKRPSRIVLRFEDLPKTSTRKVKRAHVRDWLRQTEQPKPARRTGVVIEGVTA